MTMDSTGPESSYDAAHRQALGNRLQSLRRSKGITAQQLCERLNDEIGPSTISSYEVGIRHMSVQRLVKICDCIGINAPDLLAQVARDLADASTIWVSAHLLTTTDIPELRPLRSWAIKRTAEPSVPRRQLVEFDPATIKDAAQLCGLSTEHLKELLESFRAFPSTQVAQ